MNRPDPSGRSLPQICLDVHQTTTGSYEGRSDKQQKADLTALRKRLKEWEPATEHGRRFDNAMYGLVHVTIREYDLRQKEV